ncbi:MAG: LETM1-related biofilm-associated protein [Psychroflexus halocasei]|uniref:LETM1-related biofilm-associated protein n=1 Tax=Psychroflexus sp. S27 TaxID=1982757 RepID=UPI000C2A39AB|nr:LETM1-related biofilm-associated protein [Psychroflexus sp. S27]PJX24665.1 hypothetical protein CAP47_04055 [Psychroflexus sp. S27]
MSVNPSANAWVIKLLNILENQNIDAEKLYPLLRENGFIYGTNLNEIYTSTPHKLNYTQEELAKLNLLSALFYVYQIEFPNRDLSDFQDKLISFYGQIQIEKKHKFFEWPSFKSKPDVQIEKLMHQRIKAKTNLLEKNFSNIVTNTLLNIDVECFRVFCQGNHKIIEFASQLETALINVISIGLHKKSNKSNYEELLIKLLESSLRYQDTQIENFENINLINFDQFKNKSTKLYILDAAAMSIFSDEIVDDNERQFIHELGQLLKLSSDEIHESIKSISSFVRENYDKIPYFNNANPIKNFYDKTYRSTSLLIIRNKNRLIKEISQSKELLILLKKSTHTDLSHDEKKIVKRQLMDIFKSIPSLAIFAIPGGSVLLPIIIKLIPTLLPSAFNENLEEN